MSLDRFSGDPKTVWLSEDGADRRMRLLQDFWYEDPTGKRWLAPQGSAIDGASIPQALWSSVGSPYTGNYRRASIVHDMACSDPAISREDADEMFYSACLTGGCSTLQAKLLYAGVRVGSWATSQPTLADLALSKFKFVYKLPGQQTAEETIVRGKFVSIAHDLSDSSDDFATVKELVDKHLSI